MIAFNNQVTIDQPLDQVFPFVADLENIPLWNYYVMEVSKQTDGKLDVGSEFHQIRKTDTQNLRIIEFEPNRKLKIKTIPPSTPSLTRDMVFHGENGSTIIEDHWQLDTGTPAILKPIAARKVKNAVLENLTKLKELLETGQTTLQDGRRIQKST